MNEKEKERGKGQQSVEMKQTGQQGSEMEDTQRERYRDRGGAFLTGVLSVLSAVFGTICGLSTSIFATVQFMYVSTENNGWAYIGQMDTLDFIKQHDVAGYSLATAIISAILYFALMITHMVVTGRYSKTRDGNIYLNWFDKIWSEVQIVAGVLAAVGAVYMCSPIYLVLMRDTYMDFYVPFEINKYVFDIPNNLTLALSGLGMLYLIFIADTCLISLIKKIKAHQFWDKSLFGGCIISLVRMFRTSSSTALKITLLLCVMVLMSCMWLPAIIFLVLIFMFVPKQMKRLEEIEKGVNEVKNGNLDYKIPIDTNIKYGLGELERIARGINEISRASEIAVENELRNQHLKTELISNVSHDLKTPLTSMLSYIDLMKKEGLNSENAPEYLRIIDEKTQRLKILTENLFEAAKASSGNMPCDITNIDLAALVSQSVGEMGEKLEERGLETIVRNDCADGDTMIQADGQLMWRVIENLLSNAIKYAMAGSRVYINLSKTQDTVVMEIKNVSKNPLNIPPEELMERFTRGDESRNTEGSGLGLAIARDLINLMGGKFEIKIDGDLFKAIVTMKPAKENKQYWASSAVVTPSEQAQKVMETDLM